MFVEHPELYSLYLEGSILTALKESENSLSEAIPEEVTKQRRTSAMLDPLGIRGAAFAFLPGMSFLLSHVPSFLKCGFLAYLLMYPIAYPIVQTKVTSQSNLRAKRVSKITAYIQADC